MTAPYRDHIQAIRAALNVEARSLYKPARWQALAKIGYREAPAGRSGDLTRQERFEQDCMTHAFLRGRLPPVQWATLVVRHAILPQRVPDLRDREGTERYLYEFRRLKVAVIVVAGHLDYPDAAFARWAVANWGGKLDRVRARWDRWVDHDLAIKTLKGHYGSRIKPELEALLQAAEGNAHRLLGDAGVIQRVAA